MGKLVRCASADELPRDITDIMITSEGPDQDGKHMAWATSGSGDSYKPYFRTESVFGSGDVAVTYMRKALTGKIKR